MSLVLFIVLLVTCCGYALLRGGQPERAGAALLLTAFFIDEIVHRTIDGRSYASVEIGSTVVDMTLLLTLIVLAHFSTRFWPLWVAAWQLAAVIAHFAKLVAPDMAASGYAVQAQVWSYPMVVVVAIGAWRHRARRRAGDPDPPWKVVAA